MGIWARAMAVAASAVMFASSSLPEAALAVEAPLRVVAYGDSFSAGEGLPNIDPGETDCQRALGRPGQSPEQSTAWGVKVAREWAGDAAPAWFAACTGAETKHWAVEKQKIGAVAGIGGHERPATQRAEALGGLGLPDKSPNLDAITLTFGGNDIDFSGKIYDCLGLDLEAVASLVSPVASVGGWLIGAGGRCSSDTDKVMRERIAKLSDPDPDRGLVGFYRKVAEDLAPGGTLVVAGYPQVLATVAEWPAYARLSRRCSGIHLDDADKLNGINAYLNEVIAQAVSKASELDKIHRYQWVDVTKDGGTFGPSHSLCGSGDAFLNPLTPGLQGAGLVRFQRSFHPNQKGHDAYAESITNKVPKSVIARPAPTTTTTPALDLTLDLTGLGPLRFDMTASAAAATRAASPYDSIVPDDPCGFAGVGPLYKEGDFNLTYQDRRLVRFDVTGSRIRTPSGIGVGSPSSKLRAVEGIRSEKPHHYNEATTQVRFVKGKTGYQFDVKAGRIESWAAGTPEAHDLVEGCA